MPNGNCLFSSASIFISGTNDFIYDLRILTAFELLENYQQYCDHPLFSEVYNENRGIFTSVRNIFDVCLTEESSKQEKSAEDKVKHEALYCCHNKIYSSFINVLALSRVLGLNIITWYPDVFEVKYKLIFSRSVEPIGMYLDNFSVAINLWWCPLGSDKPNHFVPLIESYKQVKCNGKRKRTSTETSIGTPSTSKYSQKSVSDNFEKSFEDVCRTRWVARIEGLITFYQLIKHMLSCFQELQLWVPRDVTWHCIHNCNTEVVFGAILLMLLSWLG